MADFPTSVSSWTDKTDGIDFPEAEDVNQPNNEVIAIQNWLLTGGGSNQTPYRISVTVASNNLTVALKNLNGDDPSATQPVKVQIGDTVRTITSALSVTKNAGTNWCNSGSAELATLEVDYFVYLGYNATDGVVIGFSRIPYASVYSDFSATTTEEKYAAISTITNAAAADSYVNIGRFAATLSAGAGYTWTVPTFTNANLKHEHTIETRPLTFVPQWANLTVGDGNQNAYYSVRGNTIKVAVTFNFGSTSSVSGGLTHTAPFVKSTTFYDTAGASDINPFTQGRLRDANAAPAWASAVGVQASNITILALDASGTYLKQAILSSTIPFTWAVNDQIDHEIMYVIQ
jgi:hypothetical protein